MSREKILARIQKAEAAGESFDLPDLIPSGPVFENPGAKFRQELESLGGILQTASPGEGVRLALEKILNENDARSLTWEKKELLEWTDCVFPPAFQFSSEDFFTSSLHPDKEIQKQLNLTNIVRNSAELGKMEISISQATAAIAETGSIVESVKDTGSRIMPILAPVHVVLLPAEKLVNSQFEFFSSFQPGVDGSAQIIMSGASRTADIEKTLIVGVHGPKKLYVILIK